MRQVKEVLGVKIAGGLEQVSTPWGGLSLPIELFRRSGISDVGNRALPAKGSAKGLTQGQMVESFLVLSALGGDCLEDLRHLKTDKGLEAILGYELPAPETARHWLDRFHDESLMAERPLQGSFIPSESRALEGLKEVRKQTVLAYIEAAHPGWDVTFDVDAQLIETNKTCARYCYEGYKAFQPIEVCWAETGLVLSDQFRDGNVPAYKDIKEVVDDAYEMLPSGPWQVRIRSDSAAYQQRYLDHWDGKGWKFAVSATMSPQLKEEIERLPEESWQIWETDKAGTIHEWAEVPYVPTRHYEKKGIYPFRYLAIRVRRQQGYLFEDGSNVKHFAVVSNIWDMGGQELLEWQRGKAGTIEHIHHVLDNELAAGVFPSAKHGGNAAWLRLQVITHNLLQLLKRVALPDEYANARPKKLRFSVFTIEGRVINHARSILLRIGDWIMKGIVAPARNKIRAVNWDTG